MSEEVNTGSRIVCDAQARIICSRLRRLGARLAIAISFALLLSIDSVAWTEQPPYVITQKHIMFSPQALTLNRGDTVQFFNDEVDLLHHAYVETDAFRFDAGDQKPGTRTNIVFSVPGTFNVLCGIHPRMKLLVTVR
jgi:plastocyanin